MKASARSDEGRQTLAAHHMLAPSSRPTSGSTRALAAQCTLSLDPLVLPAQSIVEVVAVVAAHGKGRQSCSHATRSTFVAASPIVVALTRQPRFAALFPYHLLEPKVDPYKLTQHLAPVVGVLFLLWIQSSQARMPWMIPSQSLRHTTSVETLMREKSSINSHA